MMRAIEIYYIYKTAADAASNASSAAIGNATAGFNTALASTRPSSTSAATTSIGGISKPAVQKASPSISFSLNGASYKNGDTAARVSIPNRSLSFSANKGNKSFAFEASPGYVGASLNVALDGKKAPGPMTTNFTRPVLSDKGPRTVVSGMEALSQGAKAANSIGAFNKIKSAVIPGISKLVRL